MPLSVFTGGPEGVDVHMEVVLRSSDSRRPTCTHQEKERKCRGAVTGQAARGDELLASPRSDTARHEQANSFQAAGEGGRKGEERGGGGERGEQEQQETRAKYIDFLCLGSATRHQSK